LIHEVAVGDRSLCGLACANKPGGFYCKPGSMLN